MIKPKRMSNKKSKRYFKSSADRTHRFNLQSRAEFMRRGGIRM